jgi:hypothetical protein
MTRNEEKGDGLDSSLRGGEGAVRLSTLRYHSTVIRRICIGLIAIPKLHFTSRDVAAKRGNLVLLSRCLHALFLCIL